MPKPKTGVKPVSKRSQNRQKPTTGSGAQKYTTGLGKGGRAATKYDRDIAKTQLKEARTRERNETMRTWSNNRAKRKSLAVTKALGLAGAETGGTAAAINAENQKTNREMARYAAETAQSNNAMEIALRGSSANPVGSSASNTTANPSQTYEEYLEGK